MMLLLLGMKHKDRVLRKMGKITDFFPLHFIIAMLQICNMTIVTELRAQLTPSMEYGDHGYDGLGLMQRSGHKLAANLEAGVVIGNGIK